MNLATDFNQQTIALTPDYEGDVIATLLSSKHNTKNRKSVLYIHGFIDYFFHPHVCQEFITKGYDFYAIDLRKYGRSILPHQRANYCKSINEYFEEITIAINQISKNSAGVYLLGHSTGGLIASAYMNSGVAKNKVSGIILNAPFLDLNQTNLEKKIMGFVAKTIARISPYAKVNGALSPVYPKSIHKDFNGKWDFNLAWKPIKGFPTYFKWLAAIITAQQSLLQSNIQAPILLLHASQSIKTNKHSAQVMSADIVLDIEDMKRIGPKLGTNVTLTAIKNAQHDVFLSSEKAQQDGFTAIFNWLKTY